MPRERGSRLGIEHASHASGDAAAPSRPVTARLREATRERARPWLRENWRLIVLSLAILATAGVGAGWLTDAGGSYQTLRLISAILTAVLAVSLWRPVYQVVRGSPAILAFLGWSFLTLFWSADRLGSVTSLTGLVAVVALAGVLVVMARIYSLPRLLLGLFTATSAVSMALLIVAPDISTTVVVHPTEGLLVQPKGIFVWNSDFGFAAGLGATLALSALGKRASWLAGLALAVNLSAVVISNSVTALAVTAAGLVIVALAYWRRIVVVGLVLGGVALILGGLIVGFPTLVRELFAVLGRSATLTGRTALWAETLQQSSSRWLIGHGVGTTPDFSGISRATHSHNGYLQILFDRGLVGLVILLAVCTLGVLARIRARSWGLLGATGMVLVANLTNSYFSFASLGLLLVIWSCLSFRRQPRTQRHSGGASQGP